MNTDLGDLRLFVRYDEGSGPVMVLLHGINSDGTDWRTVIDTIGPGYRFIAFDLLGFGESPKPLDIDYSADDHALVLENSLRDLGVDEPFLLVGYSLGGDVAIRYASTYPDRLRRLFLLSTPFYLPPLAFSQKNFGAAFLEEIIFKRLWKMIARSKRDDNAIYRLVSGRLEDFAKGFLRTGDVPRHWDIMSKNLVNCIGKATFVDDLPKLTMPTIFALGVRDPIVHPDQTPALKRLKPDMEVRRIVGLTADHFMLMNLPERVAHEIMYDEIRELNVAWRGGSGAPLVLLHALERPSEEWLPAAQALSRGNDVAVIDLLGFGDSPRPLASHYTLEDHVSAVLGTVRSLWGQNRAVRFAGDGLGAMVALGCAATGPELTAEVIAFSPPLLEPGRDIEELAGDERAARLLALRAEARVLARDERARMVAAERTEGRLIPLLRSLEYAVLAIDAERLMNRVEAPVRIVAPKSDTILSLEYLESVCARREQCELLTPEGGPGLPASDPAAAVRAIDPADTEAAVLAEHTPPVRIKSRGTIADLLGGVENALLRNGLLNIAAAVALMAFNPLPQGLLVAVFAIWVASSAVSTIIGAIGLRRSGVGAWLPWLLIGVVGVAFAVYVSLRQDLAVAVISLVIAIYAAYHGFADLYIAWRVRETAKPRWLLYLGGTVGIATALAIFFAPGGGRNLVRISLEVYLIATGGSLVAYSLAVKRAARRRVRELLER